MNIKEYDFNYLLNNTWMFFSSNENTRFNFTWNYNRLSDEQKNMLCRKLCGGAQNV